MFRPIFGAMVSSAKASHFANQKEHIYLTCLTHHHPRAIAVASSSLKSSMSAPFASGVDESEAPGGTT
jgi:hypothetical protein